MTKLTRSKGRTMACLILTCLFLAQGCRKDRLQSKTVENENQLIKEDVIDNWIKNNPASKYLNLDWSKAKQAIIDGKQVVRIPLLPPSKNTSSKLGLTSTLNQAKLSTVSTGISDVNKTAASNTDNNNTNYNRLHAPEVFFIQEGNNEKLHTFLINFVASDTEHDFGDNGIWSGKLYEWNVTADTIFVQKMVRSHLREKYLLKYKGNTPVDPGGIELAPKNTKLQSLTGVGNRKTSNVFTWILDKLEDAIGWFGSLFGLSYWGGSNIYGQTAEDAGYRILPINWSFLTGGGSGPGSGSYVGAGMGIYGSYIEGYQGNMDLGLNYGTSTPGNIVYTDYPNHYHGPYPPTQTVSEAPNADGVYVLEYLTVSPAAQDYILTIPAVPLAKILRVYLADHNYTNESRAFASWAAEYITTNPSSFNQAFKDFLNGSDDTIPEDENTNSSLNLNIPSTFTPTFSLNGFGVFTSNGSQTDTYPENHPVSVAIANYNQWIYRALIGANNTSVKHLHLNSKGLAASDAYAKAIGAIGEGIFAQRVTTEYPTSPGGNMYIGYYINTTHIDALQEHYLPGAGGSYYGLQVNYTDINGNPLSKKFEYPDPSHSTTLEKGRIAYEIKTNNVNRNSAATLYQTFMMGINQTVHRANIRGIDAGVLVMDYDAWKKLLNSSYGQQVVAKLNEVYNIKNDKNEQKIFLRIEKNLWSDANKAYWDILGKIKNL